MNKFKLIFDYFRTRNLTEKETDILLESSANGDINNIDNILSQKNVRITKVIMYYMFFHACQNNHLNLINYLFTSNNTKKFHDIHSENINGLVFACERGYLDIVKYLLSSPKLSKHADIHAENDKLFMTAYNAERPEIVEYLIFDCNLEKTPAIEENIKKVKSSEPSQSSYIQNKQYHFMLEIEKMFDRTSVNRDLNKELPVNDKKVKKIKI